MEALKRKLNSRRGASILLALLFFLLCIMVGASVLAAAASNAGKIRSNREEQQKYLTLSSTLNLLIDELESVEYVGLYKYVAVDCTGEGTDAYGNTIYYHDQHRAYTQMTGALRHKADGSDTWLDGVLPFVNDLDYIFDGQFYVPEYERNDEGDYTFRSLSVQGVPLENPAVSYTLDLQADVTGDYGGLTNDKVRVEVTLRTDGSIKLVATLWEKTETVDPSTGVKTVTWEKTDYTMEALLRPKPDDEWPEKRLVLPNDPTLVESGTAYRTESIQWKLEYIFKKEATVT